MEFPCQKQKCDGYCRDCYNAASGQADGLQYVMDCWRAAEVEGLHEAIAEGQQSEDGTPAARLADLLTRRIGYGIEHARALLDAPVAPAPKGEAALDRLERVMDGYEDHPGLCQPAPSVQGNK